MRSWPMLMRRKGNPTWYYRRTVPRSLRPLMNGRRQIWKSLRTTDLNQAKLLSLQVGQEVERELQALAKRADALRVGAEAPDAPERVAREYESRALTADFEDRRRNPRPPRFHEPPDELDGLLMAYSATIEDHASALDRGDVGIVSKLLDDVLTEYGLHVPPACRHAFASSLLKAHVRVLQTLERREQGADSAESAAAPTVEELLVACLRERKLGSKSEAEVRGGYRRFVAIVGTLKVASDVSKADCRAYKESLLAAPSNRSLSKDSKLSPVSVKKLMGICATVFRYRVSQGYLDTNPFEGLTRIVRGDRAGVERRLPNDASDLKAIFGSKAFQELTGVKRWLPLVALYSGCRVEEGGGLRVKDVRHEDGVDYFDFTPTTEHGLKTASSRRKVPIHPELVRSGFLDYVKGLPEDGRLFPELKAGPHGKLTGAFSKWWARFTDEVGVTDSRKTFHSLRHCFKDACRAAGLSEEVHDALTGHVSGAVGRTYGRGVPLHVLAEAVGKLRYVDDPTGRME